VRGSGTASVRIGDVNVKTIHLATEEDIRIAELTPRQALEKKSHCGVRS